MRMKKDKCPDCGSTNIFYDEPASLIDRVWPKMHCFDCEVKVKPPINAVTIEVSPHEQTTIGDIAAKYLIGRQIVLENRKYEILDAHNRDGSRIALRIILDNGTVRNLYLPTKLELVREENN
jgi:hypothetical protein